jgi:hypothetical protein
MQLAEHDRVQLIWVPGHEGIDGNETADQLDKLGSEHPFIGPEPACDISVGVPNMAARDWTIRDLRKHWDSVSGLKQAKALMQRPSAKKRSELLYLNRDQLRWEVGLTGQCHLKGHLFKLGLVNSPRRDRCLVKDESATHILCVCEVIAYLRCSHTGRYFMEPRDCHDTPIRKVLRFIRSVGLTEG